ncbi:unnamed protein product [Rotaria sp. Silwood2]|nr:unnamed protein product [Rotaria sp. Silwood2]CAF4700654.1 unnamed protein product [Rotaria sp. Silwood2]
MSTRSESNSNVTRNVEDIIEIPIIQQRSQSIYTNPLKPQYFYTRYQDVDQLFIVASTATFTQIPGLSLAVHHAVPMIYKIQAQTSPQLQKPWAHCMIHILINEKVLISNKLQPNNDKRLIGIKVWNTNINFLDIEGGSLFCSGDASAPVVPFFKSELIIMPPGTYVIEVGARTDAPPLWIHGGELRVEMTEYDPNLHVGLTYPTVRHID